MGQERFDNRELQLVKLTFQRSRSQAVYFNETWELTLDEYCDIWGDDFWRRGRASEELCMKRLDTTGPWSKDNVTICERRDYVKKNGAFYTRS